MSSRRIWRWFGAAVAVSAAITIAIAPVQLPPAEEAGIVGRILACTVPPFLFNAIGSFVSWRRAKARAAQPPSLPAVAPPTSAGPQK